jgi:hypothetical protein
MNWKSKEVVNLEDNQEKVEVIPDSIKNIKFIETKIDKKFSEESGWVTIKDGNKTKITNEENLITNNGDVPQNQEQEPKEKSVELTEKEREIAEQLIIGANYIKEIQAHYAFVNDDETRSVLTFGAYLAGKDVIDKIIKPKSNSQSGDIKFLLATTLKEYGWKNHMTIFTEKDMVNYDLLEFKYADIRPYGEVDGKAN